MSSKLKKFLSYYKPYKKLIIMDLFCALLTSGISILIPLIISHITGDLIGENFITDENPFIVKESPTLSNGTGSPSTTEADGYSATAELFNLYMK